MVNGVVKGQFPALQLQLDRLDTALKDRIPAINAAVGALELPAVVVN